MDLHALADFHRIVSHGGVGRASRATGQAKTTLSRRLRELEESLGVRLIERGPRGLRLTEEGAALQLRTQSLLAEIEEAGQAITGGLSRPRGRLRVSAPTLFCDVFMGRIAAGFAARYPDVELEVSADDRTIDLVAESVDFVVRVNPRPDGDLVGRCFLRDETLVVASASLARLPPGDGAGLRAVVPAVLLTALPQTSTWVITQAGRKETLDVKPVLRLSSFLMIREAVRAGAGAALLPRSLVEADLSNGNLVSWGAFANRTVELWALHASSRLVSPKVTAFLEFLCEAFPDRGVRRQTHPSE